MRTPETGDYYSFKQAVLAMPLWPSYESVGEENGGVSLDGGVWLDWFPMRPGTLRGWIETGVERDDDAITRRADARVFIYDDADGRLIVDGKVVATLDYRVGEGTFHGGEYRGAEYVFEYFFDSMTSFEDCGRAISIL